jgi:parvulin-like peptidyl-prolyl isomerase
MPWRGQACRGLLAVWLLGFGLPASAVQDLRINDAVLPGKSIGVLEQALTRIKFNTDKANLRKGLVENHLLALEVEAELTPLNRQDLDALVQAEASNLLEQVYGKKLQHDIVPFLQEPQALSAERLREVLAPKAQGVVLNSLWLSAAQQAEAAKVELISWQFPGQPRHSLDLLELYQGVNVQGQVELQQGNLALLAQLVREQAQRDYLWYQVGQQGFTPAEQQGLRQLVRDKLIRHKYLHQIGLYNDFHHETDSLKQLARGVTDAQAEGFYQRHLPDYQNVAQVQAAHIRLTDQATADRVYAELQGGLAFADAVQRYSTADDKQRTPPGDLGLIRHDDSGLSFLHKAALIQKANSLSQPMLIDGGFEIIQVRSREDRQLPLSDPSVRFEVNQGMARELLAQQFDARLQALVSAAKVTGG